MKYWFLLDIINYHISVYIYEYAYVCLSLSVYYINPISRQQELKEFSE